MVQRRARLGFASLSEDELKTAVSRLADAAQRALSDTSRGKALGPCHRCVDMFPKKGGVR